MDRTSRPPAGRKTWTALLATVFFILGGLWSPSLAWAHGDGETTEGYLLVQQALAHLGHDTSSVGVSLAMEKIDDALATTDQEGVDVAQVKEAQAALDAGKVEEGRTLLQQSITEAVSKLKPATGEETGTTIVQAELPGRGALVSRDWSFLGISVLLLIAGALLAARFRPVDNVGALRRRLAASQLNTDQQAETMKDKS